MCPEAKIREADFGLMARRVLSSTGHSGAGSRAGSIRSVSLSHSYERESGNGPEAKWNCRTWRRGWRKARRRDPSSRRGTGRISGRRRGSSGLPPPVYKRGGCPSTVILEAALLRGVLQFGEVIVGSRPRGGGEQEEEKKWKKEEGRAPRRRTPLPLADARASLTPGSTR